jgi:pyruvate dehydrogenase E1 component
MAHPARAIAEAQPARPPISLSDLAALRQVERKVAWLAAWTIHHANHLRGDRGGLKVGGHQASCASIVTLMTALYFHALRPQDRVAVKPHASPVFHAIQYLFGRQGRDQLENFRGYGGAQSYPSRTKDADDVDISTGSVGLGGAMTVFTSLAQDYLGLHGMAREGWPQGRMIALFGDAEFDEGNVFEALLESWKHEVRNTWWIIDYNRQSLDSVVSDRLFNRFDGTFSAMNWEVRTLKYGKLLRAQAERPGGEALLRWIDECPNQLYSALTFKGGAAWREHLRRDLGDTAGIRELLDSHDDETLHALITNLAGHDLETVLEAFEEAAESDAPCAFIAYTIKGHGLPLAGHKDNHAGLMTPDQMALFKAANGIADGAEWDRFAGLELPAEALEAFIAGAPFAAEVERRFVAPKVPVPERLETGTRGKAATSTQEAFGRLLDELARGDSELARRIVTTSPDVTVSTSLGPWVNRRQIFDRRDRPDTFREERVASAQKWAASPVGQHIELGIAENNLFLTLAAFGLAAEMFGTRLLPVGTLYDPFIGRGLDALNYACYQDARFMVVGTPSGITLAPEGGAHQSVSTPLIGIGQPGLVYFEPAFVDELAAIMRWGFAYMQADDGSSVYLRLSPRPLEQPARAFDARLPDSVIEGAYRAPTGRRRPRRGRSWRSRTAAQWRRKRSPRSPRCARTCRVPASSRCPRPTACTRAGSTPRNAAAAARRAGPRSSACSRRSRPKPRWSR